MSGQDAGAAQTDTGGASESTASDASMGCGATRIVGSDTLLRKEGALAIRHRGSIYYLRETRFGKLILTK